MPTPFAQFYTDSVQVEKPTAGIGVNGMGEKVTTAQPLPYRAKMIVKPGVRRSPNGDFYEYHGKMRYDWQIYNVEKNDTVTFEGIKYVVIDFVSTGGLPGIPKEKAAILKWLV